MLAYNASCHSSTNFSPYKLFVGREILMPLDLKTSQQITAPEHSQPDFQDYVNSLHQHLSHVFSTARANSLKAALKRKELLDKTAKLSNFAVGQNVWLKSNVFKPGQCAKWSAKLVGPFKIIKAVGKANFVIQRSGSKKEMLVHADRLKLDVNEEHDN